MHTALLRLVFLSLCGCSVFRAGPSPTEIATRYQQAEIGLDATTLQSLLSSESRARQEKELKSMSTLPALFKAVGKFKFSHSHVEVLTSEASDSKATVRLKVTQPGGFFFELMVALIEEKLSRNEMNLSDADALREIERASGGAPNLDDTISTVNLIKEDGRWRVVR